MKNTGFWIPLGIFLFLGGIFQLLISRDEAFLMMNKWCCPSWDFFFTTITHLGDGWLALFLVIFLFFKKFKWAIIATFCFGISSLITIFLKEFVFTNFNRPSFHFKVLGEELYLVEGINQRILNSFPSGHTTSIFAVCAFLALLIPNKKWGVFFFIIALLTGYSRIYLSQHFFTDVYFGAIIGSFITLLVFNFMNKKFDQNPRNWHEKGFFK